MAHDAVFTISKGSKGLDIKCKAYNTFNRVAVAEAKLFDVMSELADIFNNVIGVGIEFVVE